MIQAQEELEEELQTAKTEEARADGALALAWYLKKLDVRRCAELSEDVIRWARENKDERRLAFGLISLGVCVCFQARVDEGRDALQESLAFGRRLGDSRIEARCQFGYGLAHCIASEVTLAREPLETAARLFEELGDAEDLAACYNTLGGTFRETGDCGQALSYLDRARQLREQIEDIAGLGSTLINIGNIYADLGDHENALEFHLRSLEAYRQTGFPTAICRTLVCLAVDYSGLKQYEKAIEVGEQARAMAFEQGLKIDQIASLLNLGPCYLFFGRSDDAEEVYRQALDLARQGNDLWLTCSALGKLGNLLHQRNRPVEARRLLMECVQLGEMVEQARAAGQAHYDLAAICREAGDFEAALEYFQSYHALHEKIYSEDAAKHSKRLFIQMEVEKARQEAEIHRLRTVDLAEANARLQALATTDPLTGLANHRGVVASLDVEMERCHRYDHSCALLFLDIDHFKTLNDSYGHPVGDAVLQEFANLVKSCLRGPDTVGRWGGEEFVALLPETDIDGAHDLAERVRSAVADRIFDAAGGLHVTVSIGVAESRLCGTDRDALVEAADKAVYAAKRLGRNQVRLSTDPAIALVEASSESGREAAALSGMVQALAALVAVRDSYAGEHHDRVAALAVRLALALGLGSAGARQIGVAARLYDLGKVAIPDAILHKTTSLTDRDWETLTHHPVIGAEVVGHVPGLRPLAPLIRSHHERWDGGGYPDGLAGEAIPLGARILAVADAWGAMTTERPYRGARTADWAVEELKRCAGTQFDPSVVAVFLSLGGCLSAAA